MGNYGRVVTFWAASLVALGLLVLGSRGGGRAPSRHDLPAESSPLDAARGSPAALDDASPNASDRAFDHAPDNTYDNAYDDAPADAPGGAPSAGAPRYAGRVRRGPVLDGAHLLDPSQARQLVAELRRVARSSGVQFAVWTVPDVPEAAEGTLTELSLRQAEKLRLGQPNKDDGLLLSVAPKLREARLEVGYGLEGVLPDATAAQILRRCFAVSEGASVGGEQVLAAVVAVRTRLEQAVANGSLAPPERRPDRPAEQAHFPFWPLVVVLLLLLWSWTRGGGSGGPRGRRGLGPLPWTLLSGALDTVGSGRRSGGGGREDDTRGGGGGFGGGGASSRW